MITNGEFMHIYNIKQLTCVHVKAIIMCGFCIASAVLLSSSSVIIRGIVCFYSRCDRVYTFLHYASVSTETSPLGLSFVCYNI